MNDSATLARPISIKRFKSPKSVLARFTFRHNYKAASIYALIFSAFTASKAIGFVQAYPTAAARQKVIELFSSNTGLEAILGPVNSHGSTGSYVAWNTFSLMLIIGIIWGLLLVTKLMRGEEDAGRWEILLTGQTTARRAVVNVLGGIAACLLVFYIILSLALTAIGRYNGLGFDGRASLFFALAVTLGIGFFVVLGALSSQIMSTRAKAASVTAAIFAAFYLLELLVI